jgi:hypothetical protein
MNLNPRASRGEASDWLASFLVAPEQTDDCILWPFSLTGRGYGQIRSTAFGTADVHVIVCEHFHGPKPVPGMVACHSHTGNRHCCNPRHIRWDTQAANLADRIVHGTSNRGERHGLSRLTSVQVSGIRERYGAGGISQRSLAREYGVHQTTISLIVRGKRWP